MRLLALLAFIGFASGSWAGAQSKPVVEIRFGPDAFPPAVSIRGVLSERPFNDMLLSGFPARLHVRAELWTEQQWFDDMRGRVEWDIVVRYDAVDRSYDVVRLMGSSAASLGSYSQFALARSATELAYTPALPTPPRGKKSYVLVQAELQSLQVSDLDELERWLRGEARPAVQGKRSPASALTRGMRTLVSRLLGGEVRRMESRSPSIRF